MGGLSATSTSFGRVRLRIGSSGLTPIAWTRSVRRSRPTAGDSPTARLTGLSIPAIATPRSSSLTSTQQAMRPSRCGSMLARRSSRRVRSGRPTAAASPSIPLTLHSTLIDRKRGVRYGLSRSQTATSTCCRTCWPPTLSGRLRAPELAIASGQTDVPPVGWRRVHPPL